MNTPSTAQNTSAAPAAPTQLTDVEKYIDKHEVRVRKMKHLDVLVAMNDIVFPILRKLAAASGDQAEGLAQLAEQVGAGSDDNLATFEAAKDVIEKLAVLLDTAMVSAGFYKVTRTGLVETGKAPPDMYQAYAALAVEVTEVLEDIGAAIEDLSGDDEGGEDGASTAADVGPVGVQSAGAGGGTPDVNPSASDGADSSGAAPAGPAAGGDVDAFEPPSGAPDVDLVADGAGGPDASP
jgi:hypothetical protein